MEAVDFKLVCRIDIFDLHADVDVVALDMMSTNSRV